MSAEDTQALARELERFHALIYAVTSAPRFESPIPTRIYAFERKRHYHRYEPSETAGVFHPGIRANTIVLTDYSNRLGASQIILHEYTHFVLRNGTVRAYPFWYDEGLAELMSSARTYENLIAIGEIPKVRIPAFQYGTWLPIDKVVSAPGSIRRDEVHMLYAESWALVHYLALDRASSGTIQTDLSRYMSLVESGVEPVEAFEEAFGERTGQVGIKIKRMLARRKLRVIGIPIENLEYDRSAPTARVPTEGEVAVRLGQLQLMYRDGEAAEIEFAAAVALDPNAPRALAGLGDALKFQNKWAAAEPYFYQAVEIAPDDPMNQLDLAEFLHGKALRASSTKERKELLKSAREVYAKYRALDDGIPEVWMMEGRTYLAPGENPREGIAMLNHALEMLPSSPRALRSLAEARVALGQDRMAAKLIRKAYAHHMAGDLLENTQEFIDEIKAQRAAQAEKVAQAEKSGDEAESIP